MQRLQLSAWPCQSIRASTEYTGYEHWKVVKHLALRIKDRSWDHLLNFQHFIYDKWLLQDIEEMDSLQTLCFISTGPSIERLERVVWETLLTGYIARAQMIPEHRVPKIVVATEIL